MAGNSFYLKYWNRVRLGVYNIENAGIGYDWWFILLKILK